MEWFFDGTRPIYIQIVEKIKLDIVCGRYERGGKMPSVRDIALMANVNPNTVQRAFAELEADELVMAQSTTGRFVTSDGDKISACRQQLAMAQVSHFTAYMNELGFTKSEIIDLL